MGAKWGQSLSRAGAANLEPTRVKVTVPHYP